MDQPVRAADTPFGVEVEEGKAYFWCACGLSTSQPFCDGSHQGSEFVPQAFVCAESKDYYLCQCKKSANKPYCDGSHKAFSDEQVGSPAPEGA